MFFIHCILLFSYWSVINEKTILNLSFNVYIASNLFKKFLLQFNNISNNMSPEKEK